MLDTHIHRTITAAPYPQEVTVNAAPAGDILEYAELLRDKIIASIISSVRVNNNVLNCKWVVWQEYQAGFDHKVRGVITLNGKERVLNLSVPKLKSMAAAHEAADMIRKEVLELLASEITIDLFMEHAEELKR